MSSRSGLFRGHVFKVKVLDIISSKSGFTEVYSLKVMSSRSGLCRGHVFKVRVVKRSSFQGQYCLEVKLQGQGCLDVIFSWSALYRDHVYNFRSCIQDQDCL